MKILELFSGTESFSKVARKHGHECFTIDNNPQFKPNLCKDILDLNIEDIPFKPDIIWASPPCQTFSVASIGKNWKDRIPQTEKTINGLLYVFKTLEIIKELKPKYWFIENPRGMLRKLMPTTVTYCQYGDTRMKPTDIWHNSEWVGKPICKNGDPCHVSAPRGSRTGTQGLKGNMQRSIVPKQLCEEILKACK